MEISDIEKYMQTMSVVASSDSHVKEEKEAWPPHEALFLVLTYLPLYELLAMSEACLSLRDAVNKDILPWLNIIVQRPLNSRLSDEILMKITSKANGRLTTLALINCLRITDDGLQRVVENNPFIHKLYIPGCTGLTPEGIIRAVNKLPKLEILHINGVYNITKEHLETLRSHLISNSTGQQRILYHEYRNTPLLESKEANHSIDVEICPRCNEARMVFDCSKEICIRKRVRLQGECRGCNFCIPRCAECGGCIETDEELEETVCSDLLCLDCWLQLPKCNSCNKPYCKLHASLHSHSPDSTGFVCDDCVANVVENSNDDNE